MFLQESVILLTGGVSASVHAGIHPPGADPPRSRHPLEQTPPPKSMLGDTVNAWAVRILLECNLVILTIHLHTEECEKEFDI